MKKYLILLMLAGCSKYGAAPQAMTPDRAACDAYVRNMPEMRAVQDALLVLSNRFYSDQRPFHSLIYFEVDCRDYGDAKVGTLEITGKMHPAAAWLSAPEPR